MRFRALESRARLAVDVQQLSFPVIQIELILLPVGNVEPVTIHLRVNVAVRDEDIFEAVIIEIVESRSPAQVAPGIRSDPANRGLVNEMPFARIATQRV